MGGGGGLQHPPDPHLIIKRADDRFALTFSNRNSVFTNKMDLN